MVKEILSMIKRLTASNQKGVVGSIVIHLDTDDYAMVLKIAPDPYDFTGNPANMLYVIGLTTDADGNLDGGTYTDYWHMQDVRIAMGAV